MVVPSWCVLQINFTVTIHHCSAMTCNCCQIEAHQSVSLCLAQMQSVSPLLRACTTPRLSVWITACRQMYQRCGIHCIPRLSTLVQVKWHDCPSARCTFQQCSERPCSQNPSKAIDSMPWTVPKASTRYQPATLLHGKYTVLFHMTTSYWSECQHGSHTSKLRPPSLVAPPTSPHTGRVDAMLRLLCYITDSLCFRIHKNCAAFSCVSVPIDQSRFGLPYVSRCPVYSCRLLARPHSPVMSIVSRRGFSRTLVCPQSTFTSSMIKASHLGYLNVQIL